MKDYAENRSSASFRAGNIGRVKTRIMSRVRHQIRHQQTHQCMRTIAALSVFVSLLVTTSQAQDWAKARLEKSPRHQEWVKIKHGQREVQSFIVYPEVKDKATAVVVIHEIFGLSDWVRDVADQLAEAGYIAMPM